MSDRTTGIWLVRREALALGKRLALALGADLFEPWENAELAQKEQVRAAFPTRQRWVLVMASGIAVRFLDGLPESKYSDPAVVVLDEAARFAIPLLSGHEGGANQLAYQAANAVGAVPAITTATEAVKPLTLGIGCRKGVSAERIELAVRQALQDRPLAEVREVATIDLKAEEPGLLAFCASHELPLRVIARTDVAARPWVSEPSDWVRKNVGVAGVCEPCALIASPRGRLLVPKTTLDGVAVAIVEDILPGTANS
jgi:cobalt-precorrin 5A hydrolase